MMIDFKHQPGTACVNSRLLEKVAEIRQMTLHISLNLILFHLSLDSARNLIFEVLGSDVRGTFDQGGHTRSGEDDEHPNGIFGGMIAERYNCEYEW